MAFIPLKVGSPSNDLLTMNALFNKTYNEIHAPSDIRFARMWHSDALAISGPPIVHSGVADVFPYGSYWRNFPLAGNGDTFRHFFTLNAGTYDFVIMGYTYNNAPIVGFEVDGDNIGAIDLYSAGDVDKVIFVISDVDIPTSGLHTLEGQTKNKNASSLGYNVRLYKYFFREA